MVNLKQALQGSHPTITEENNDIVILEESDQVKQDYADPVDPKGIIYTCVCVCFPAMYRRGRCYIMLLYEYNRKSILAEQMKIRGIVEIGYLKN